MNIGILKGRTGLKRELVLRKDQIRVLVSKDFKLKYNSTALGFLWSLAVPLLTSAVYYVVFGILLGACRGPVGARGELAKATPYFLLYLMSGTFIWQFFANVVTMNGLVLQGNGGLLKKTSFDRELLIWGTFYTESIHFVLTVPILFIIMLANGIMPDWLTLIPNLVICLVSLTLFAMGLSYAYAACNIFFRDLERIMNIIMMLWMFISPVFISVSIVPPELLWIYNLNPMALILQCWRDIFWSPCFIGADVPPESLYYGMTHAWHVGAYLPMLLVSSAVYYFGRRVFLKMEPAFAEMM